MTAIIRPLSTMEELTSSPKRLDAIRKLPRKGAALLSKRAGRKAAQATDASVQTVEPTPEESVEPAVPSMPPKKPLGQQKPSYQAPVAVVEPPVVSEPEPEVETAPVIETAPEIVEPTEAVQPEPVKSKGKKHRKQAEPVVEAAEEAEVVVVVEEDEEAADGSDELVASDESVRRRIAIPHPFKHLSRRIRAISSAAWIVGAYGVLLFGSQLTLIWFTKTGLVLNVLCLFVLMAGAVAREDLRKLSISLALIPVAQMACSSFILHTAFETAAVFYGILLALTLIYRYLFTLDEPVAKSQLHWRGHFYGLPLMIVIGEGLGLVGYAFLHDHYSYGSASLPLVFAASVVFAFAEEMLLRGLIQQQAARVVHPLLGATLAAVLYVPLAMSHTTLLTLGPAIAMGVFLAGVYHVKHNVLLSTAINAAAKLTYLGLVATFILR